MTRIREGKYISNGYLYLGFEIRNHGYYPPDKSHWWEAINLATGCADYHAHTKREIKDLIDKQKPQQ